VVVGIVREANQRISIGFQARSAEKESMFWLVPMGIRPAWVSSSSRAAACARPMLPRAGIASRGSAIPGGMTPCT
jgi:hypothetical protein